VLAVKEYSDIPLDPWYRQIFHTPAYAAQGPLFFEKQSHRHGDAFRYNFLGNQYVHTQDPDIARQVYLNNNDSFHAAPGWTQIFGDFFPNGLPMKDGQEHLMHRRIMQNAFKRDAMLSYFEQTQDWARTIALELATMDEVDVFQYLKDQSLNLALEMFFGIEASSDTDDVGALFVSMVVATLSVTRIPYFNTAYHKGIKARKKMVQLFTEFVEQRKSSPKSDLISYLIEAEDGEGNRLTTEQIVDHLIFTLVAAHDTTASSLTSLIYYLTRLPEWQAILNQEAMNVGTLTYDNLDQLVKTENLFKETLRLNPPVTMTPRKLTQSVELGGFQLPKDAFVGIDIYAIHRNKKYWQDPEKFDPERFARGEDKQHPFLFIPFSGGVHKCIGMHLSIMQAKILLKEIFSTMRVERTEPGIEIKFGTVPTWHPKTPIKVRFFEAQ
jgi:cytochrome P450